MEQLYPPSTAQRIWIPAGNLKTAQRRALAVRASQKPDFLTWHLLLGTRLQDLIDANPAAARDAMQMSEEFAPEIFALSLDVPASGWGMAIASSDSVHAIAGRIEWSKPGHLWRIAPSDLFKFLEMLP